MNCIVVPVANEKDSIRGFISQVECLKIPGLRIVFVTDSYSTDGTKEIIAEIAAHQPGLLLLDLGRSGGLAQAYLAGLQYARDIGAEKVIEVDVGHPVSLIPAFLEALDHAEVAFASRYISGASVTNTPIKRRVISMLGTVVSRLLLRMPFSDCTSGLQGFRHSVLKRLPLDNFLSRGYIYQTEMKYYCSRLNFQEIPLNYVGGNTGLRWKSVAEAVSVLMRLFGRSDLIVRRE
jgi:dolichol-phosphate mannosyltransferase